MRVIDYREDMGDPILFTAKILSESKDPVGIRDMGHLSVYVPLDPTVGLLRNLFTELRKRLKIKEDYDLHIYTMTKDWLIIVGECIDNCCFVEFLVPKHVNLKGEKGTEVNYDYDDDRSGYIVLGKNKAVFVHDPDEFDEKTAMCFSLSTKISNVAERIYNSEK